MKSFVLRLVAALMVFAALPVQASTLVDNGSTTLDTSTGLTWLDVNLTVNRSYNDVSANFGNPFDVVYGYRYATVPEITQLILDGDVSPVPCDPCANAAALSTLIDVLGPTYNDGTYKYVIGINDTTWIAFLWVDTLGGRFAYANHSAFPPGDAHPSYGSFLVQGGEVPLPAALPLFATGLGAIALIARGRKRKSARASAALPSPLCV